LVQRFLPKRQLTPEDAVHDREESGTASTIPAARLQCPGPGPRLPSEATAGRQTVSRQGIVSTPPVPRTGTAPSKRSDGGKTNRLAPRDCFRARMRFLLERTPYSRDVVVGPDAYRCWFPHPQRESCWKQPKLLSSGRALHTAWAVRGNRGAVLGLGPQPKQPGTRLPAACLLSSF